MYTIHKSKYFNAFHAHTLTHLVLHMGAKTTRSDQDMMVNSSPPKVPGKFGSLHLCGWRTWLLSYAAWRYNRHNMVLSFLEMSLQLNPYQVYAMCQALLCEIMDQIFSSCLGNGDLSEQKNTPGVQPLVVCNLIVVSMPQPKAQILKNKEHKILFILLEPLIQ